MCVGGATNPFNVRLQQGEESSHNRHDTYPTILAIPIKYPADGQWR